MATSNPSDVRPLPGRTFAVGDVALGKKRYPQSTTADAFRACVKDARIEVCWVSLRGVVETSGGNALVATARRAFCHHLPILLTPDVLWLTLLQGVANHVHRDPEATRAFFVSHQGKELIRVRHDALSPGDPNSPWPEVFPMFSHQLERRLDKRHDLLLPRFSTTGPVERIAAEIALMDVVKSFFRFEVRTLCGIPRVTLAGTPEDWRDIRARMQNFREIGLEAWIDHLKPVLDGLVATSEGDIDVSFWRDFYNEHEHSGGIAITGWIARLFPYLRDEENQPTLPNPWHQPTPPQSFRIGASESDLPSSLARVPFVWDYLKQTIPMQFVAGIVSASQDASDGTLRPEVGWAVVQDSE